MMSIASVSSTADASSYYEVDDYYTAENADEHTQLSEWHGKGAVLQGLQGSVKPEDFAKVLDGVAPDGSTIGRIMQGERQHRPGIDLTFSPPKSVAIMAQVFGDKRIVELHKEAVKETLSMIEAFAAKTRVGVNGVMKEQDTKNLTIATFYHTSTRAQDPGMHTHSVIANMTLGQDGKWRSLHNDSIWENSKARFGENYSMRLAEKLADAGYDIISSGKNAEYEIAGVPKDLIDYFSTRGRQIKDLLEERGLSGPKNREWANKQTREKKVPMDKELEEATWKERASSKGYDLYSLVEKAKDNQAMASERDKVQIAVEGVTDATNHLSQRNSAFTVQEVVQATRVLVVGKTSDAHIFKAVEKLKEQEFILHPKEDSKLLTTREVVATENDNLLRVDLGKSLFKPIATEKEASQQARKFNLNTGQTKSLIMSTRSPDRVNIVQGWAGVGKTHFGRALNELLTKKNYHVVGLSPSAQAANELEKGSGIKSNTLASFIFKNTDRLDDSKAETFKNESIHKIRTGEHKRMYIVVDESSFVSSKDFNKLLRIAETYDARILKIGDYKQLGAVDAGAPHKQLLDHGVSSEKMNDIMRQKDNPTLRDAVYAAIDDKPALAMSGIKVLQNNECQSMYAKAKSDETYRFSYDNMRSELAKQSAQEYTKLTPLQRANTALIVQNNDIRVQVNRLVRDELIAKGEIGTESLKVTSLKNVGLTDAQMRYAHNYEKGAIVRFNTESSHFNIQPNEYFKVENNDSVMGKERYLSLVSESDPNKQFLIHPKELATRGERAIEVFRPSEREIAAGDQIRWTRNDKDRGMVNTQTAIVLSINQSENKADLLFQNGNTHSVHMDELKNNHLDYNFANTAHSIQGATVDRVISVVESWHRLLTNMKSFYVGISRGKSEVTLITDSEQNTINALQKNVQREDIALTLYDRENQPLNFEVVAEMKHLLSDGVSVRDLYLDLVMAFDGDRLAAQKHMQELGIDGSAIEKDLVIENVLKQMESENVQEPQPESSVEQGSDTGFGAEDEKLSAGDEYHVDARSDEPDWFSFDERDYSETGDPGYDTDYDVVDDSMQSDSNDRRDWEMDM